MVPDDILERMKESHRSQFFERGRDGRWALKQKDGQTEPVVPSTNPKESLKEIFKNKKNKNASTDTPGNYDIFVDLIFRMLAYRPRDRITPELALEHPFIVAGEHSQSRPMSAT